MMRSFHIPAVILIALITSTGASLLSSCGQKGALKLPPKMEPKVAPAVPLTPNAVPTTLPPKLATSAADAGTLKDSK